MTRQRNDNHGTPFGTWIRENHQARIGSHIFSAQNLDYIWHNYQDNWLITIEEKRYGGMRNGGAEKAQADTHGVVIQLLQKASGAIVKTMRGMRRAEYRGHYVIVFENTTPDDGCFSINGKQSELTELLSLLETGNINS